MQNPFDLTYLTTASATLGPLGWTFLALQAVGVVAGLYLIFFRQDSNPLRKTLLAQLGLGMLILGGVGILLGVLRVNNIAVFSQRYWFYLVFLAEIGLAGYAAYYARRVYPRRLAQTPANRRSLRRSGRAAPSGMASASSHNGHKQADMVEPVQGSSRRAARQRRKRKQRS